MNSDQIEQIRNLRSQGKTLAEIGIELGYSASTICIVAQKNGITGFPVQYREVRVISYPHISEKWWAEFRGFFFGEGSIYFRATSPYRSEHLKPHKILQPCIEIALRIDDLPLLQDIQRNLSGNLYTKRSKSENRGDSCSWSMIGFTRVYSLLPFLLNAVLPAKKLREAVLMKEACETRFKMTRDLTLEEYLVMNDFNLRLRDMKLLKSTG